MRGITLYVVILMIGLAPARGEGLKADPDLDLEDLIINWRSYRGTIVSFEGSVRCENEGYCRFSVVPGLRRIVSIDISLLSAADKRSLIQGCRQNACQLVVRGEVESDDLAAREISQKEEITDRVGAG